MDHILVIFKALYGLRSSGKMWSQRWSDCLREMGFEPSKADPQIWMRRCGDVWEYIGTYVDDAAVASPNPQAIMDVLTEKYKFKLKGVGPISFHLGCDFWRDDDNTLCFAPKKYVEKMMAGYERMFGKSPSSNNVTSPLEKGDHPEIDTSELLDEEGTQQYQSLIGSMQWAISLGRFDIQVAVMTLSGFRAAPRRGHLERAKRVYSYLTKMRHSTIRVRTGEPDYSGLAEQDYDWTYTPYGNVKEQVPHDMPEPLGKFVTLTHFFDANLYHDLLTGRSVTGVLHFLNQTPIDWYAKKQSTVETATYGSEFVAARTCIEQVMDLRTTLRYLGVPIRQKSFIFGDNKSMIDSASIPHAKLHKRHTALSWHRVREAMAAGIASIYHVRSESNPADILSKHWGYSQIWNMLKPILFWKGDTMDIMDEDHVNKESTT
jgi:Reverse transcriptase (RNA-dependent DNA polymerase)